MYFRYYNRRRSINHPHFPEEVNADFSTDPPKKYIENNCPGAYKISDSETYYFRYILTVHVISEEDYNNREKHSIPLQEFTLRDVCNFKGPE